MLTLVVLAGILVGCAGGMAGWEEQAAAPLNPEAALPVLVWTGDQPQLPGFTAWEYAAQPGPPVNMEELLARIWEGREYETYTHGESGMYYRLPLYQSKYGRFREEVSTGSSGFMYGWEINENYPKSRAMDKSPGQALVEAGEYVLQFLGEEHFLEHPVPFEYTLDEDGSQVQHFYEFRWEHRLGDIPVYNEGLSLRVIPEGIPQLRLGWTTFEPLDTDPRHQPLGFDEALYALNYVRSYTDPDRCTEHSAGDYIHSARVVYSNRFSDDPALYRPVWEFVLARENKGYRYPVLVDCLTGKVASDHDGVSESSYQGRHTD